MSCNEKSKKLCGQCQVCLSRSCQSWDEKLLKRWDDDQSPHLIFKGSSTIKIKFLCSECNHKYVSSPYLFSKSANEGNFSCPFCKNLEICGPNKNCSSCLDKTAIKNLNSKKMACWSSDNIYKPDELCFGSAKIIKFNCDNCPHSFEKPLYEVTGKKQRWCPFCCRNGKLCGDSSCDYCFQKSLATLSQIIVDAWRDDTRIHQIKKGSTRKMKLQCPYCDEKFEETPRNLSSYSSWCSNNCLKQKKIKFSE